VSSWSFSCISTMITRLRSGTLGHSDFDFQRRQFSLLPHINTSSEVHQASCFVASEGFSPGSKGTWVWSCRSHLSSVTVKNVCVCLRSYTSTSPHIFMMWCLLSSRITVAWFICELWHLTVTGNFADYLQAWIQIVHNWFLSIRVQFCVSSYILKCCQCFTIYTLSVKKKRKRPYVHRWRHVRGSRCLAPLILNLGTAWRSAVNFMPRGRTFTLHWVGDQVGLRTRRGNVPVCTIKGMWGGVDV
jgi:hypothetical protein